MKITRAILTIMGIFIVTALSPFAVSPSFAAGAEDSAINVTSVEITNKFQEGVHFQVSAETMSPAVIKEIRLDMRIKGDNRSTYSYLEFTPEATVTGEYLLKAAGAQYKPPGTLIEYTITLSDSEGHTLITPPATHLYLDSRFEWNYVAKDSLEVYYYGQNKTRAELILDAGALSLQEMGELLGIKLTEPRRIVVYADSIDMIPAQPFTSEATERELRLEGVAFSEYKVFMMIADLDRPDGVASHEMTHLLVGELTANAFVSVPAWLNEGLAEYGNVNRGNTYDNLLAGAISNGRLLKLRDMQSPPGLSEERLLMYGQGYAVVKYMIETHGEVKFRELFAAFNKGQPIDTALLSVYGFDQDGLDNEWRSTLSLPQVEPRKAPISVVTAEDPGTNQSAFTPFIIIGLGLIVAVVLFALLRKARKTTSPQ